MSDAGKPEIIKKAKIKRRNVKAALTRLGKTISLQVAGNRSTEEVRKSLDLYTAISIKVVNEQSGKVEYERERPMGIAMKIH